MATPSWDSLTPTATSAVAPASPPPSWDSLAPVASAGVSAADSPNTAQPVPTFESLPTQSDYLKMLPRSRIEDEYIKAKQSGQPVDEQPYLDAYRLRAREGNLTGDKDLTGTAPSVSLWDRTKAAASSLTSGLLTEGNELGKAVLGRDLVNGSQPVSHFTQSKAFNNLMQGSQVAALRTATTVRQMVNNLANKMFRSTDAIAPIFGIDHEADDKAYDEQFQANVHAKEVESRLSTGQQILGATGSRLPAGVPLPVDPEVVGEVSNSPLADPTFLVPGLVNAKLAEEGVTAAKAVNVAAKAADEAPNIVRAALAKPAELAANAVKTANTTLDTSPLLRAATTAGITLAAGGEAPMATLAGLLGASNSKMNLLQGGLGAAESGLRAAAEKIAGRLPPGPMGQFAGKAFSVFGDQGKALLLTQAANMPFLLGTESEDDFKNMATVGILGHYALGEPLKAINSLNFANNFWQPTDHLVAERMPVKDLGVSQTLDQLHQETMKSADNTGNNFVQSMRNYFGKRAELYVLSPDKIVDAIGALKAEGAVLPPEIANNPEAVAGQNGVTAVDVSMPDGTKRNIAFATLRDGVPGLGAGHETGHLIESITSPEELKPVYEAIAQAYGEDGLAKAKKSYEQAAAASGQPYQNLTRDNVISELFAENASAVLNSVPIGEFGPEGFKGWKQTARNIYATVERGLNKIGAKVPEIEGGNGPKTGLGYDPSAPVGQLVENLLQAKKIDTPVFEEPAVTAAKDSPISDAREIPPEHALPTGLPVEEIKDKDGNIIATDGKIVKHLEPIGNEPQYEVEYTDPVDGKRKAGMVGEKALQSVTNLDGEIAPPKPKATGFPTHPVTDKTPVGVAQPKATAEELVAPKQVENVTRPAPEAPAPKPANNVRVTPEQQTTFAQKASPGVQAENTALLKSVTNLPRKDIPTLETDYYSAKSNVFSPDAAVRKEQRRLADKAETEAAKTGKPNPLRAIYQKLFVPYKFVEGSTPRVYGFSLDKVIQNVDILRGWALDKGDKALASRLDTSFANSVHDYLENQRNGYGGDGVKIKRPADERENSITPENPNYTPKKISTEDKQLVNLLMGLEQPSRSSVASRFAARMAEQNGLTPVLNSNGVEITNPLYSELVKKGFDPKLLNSAVENLPVSNFTTKLKQRNELKSAAGDVAITRAGFMPATETGEHKKAPAFFIGHQEGVGDLYNLTKAIEGHPEGSTVTKETLAKEGYSVTPRRVQGNDTTRQIAARYIEENGIGNTPHEGLAPIDETLAKSIADFYQEAKHDPKAPEVKQAYEALADETLKQYDAMKEAGIKIEPFEGKGEPYKNSKAMMDDVRDNKHLFFLKTEGNFSTSENNPLLQDSGIKAGGQKLLVNDVFRAVHDYFGHTAEGYEFGPRGEYNAYLSHSKMFSDEAKPALAAETLAQNSFVNFGKHLRREDGSIPQKGEPDFKPLSDRPFAEQKNLVVPKKLLDAVDSSSAGSASFMPAQHIAKTPLEHSLGDETLHLVHYGQGGLREIDPSKFGKSGITPRSEMSGSNRSYFYEKGKVNKTDPAVARKDIYEAAVSGSRIYDGDTDALGYSDMINREKADNLLQKEGYVGIARSAGKGKNTYKQVEMFSPTKVQPTGKASFMPSKKQTESPEFKKWFGQSKVADDEGKPIIVYRGDKPGKTSFTGREDSSNRVQGNVFFSNRPEVGRFYTKYRHDYMREANGLSESEGLYRTYLSLQNPLIVDAKGESWDEIPLSDSLKRDGGFYRDTAQIDDLASSAREMGYDGLIVRDVLDQSGDGDQYVAFHPEQIKSAIGNNGKFSSNNPDIRFQPSTGRDVLGAVKGDDEVELRLLPANSQQEHRDFGMRGDRFRFSNGTITWTDLKDEVTPQSRRAAQEQLERKGYTVNRQVDWEGHPYSSLSSANPPILKRGDKRLAHLYAR